MEYGLLGQSLGHSYSHMIHSYFGDYSYSLFEKEPEELRRVYEKGREVATKMLPKIREYLEV